MIETKLKNASHSKDRHVLRTILLLGHPMFDYLTLQKSSGITAGGVQSDGVDHTAPGFCTKEMHYPTESLENGFEFVEGSPRHLVDDKHIRLKRLHGSTDRVGA